MAATNLDAAFSALGDGTRRALLARLSEGERSISELAEPFDMSLTAVSKHLRVLSDAGLVAIEKRGRVRHCRLQAAGLKDAADWLESYRVFWESRLESLALHLARDMSSEDKKD